MSSYIQLATQIEKLKKEAEAARKREIAETIANIRRAIELFGLTADDLGLGRGGKKRGRKASKQAPAKTSGGTQSGTKSRKEGGPQVSRRR